MSKPFWIQIEKKKKITFLLFCDDVSSSEILPGLALVRTVYLNFFS